MHGWKWGEVAPAAPLLPPLLILAGLMFALGCIYFIDYFCRGLFGTATTLTSWIPWLGKKIDNGLHSVESRVTNFLGQAEQTIDARVAASWHQLTHTVEQLGAELRRNAVAIATIASLLTGNVWALLIPSIRHKLQQWVNVIPKQIGELTKHVNTVERIILKATPGQVRALVGSIVQPWERTIELDLSKLRARVKSLEDEASKLYERVKGLTTVPLPAVAAGVVAVALTYLGLGGLRCSNLRNMLNKRGCGLWSDLEGVLAVIADVLVLTNICTVIPLLEDGFSAVAGPLIGVLTKAGAGLCGGTSAQAPELTVPTLYLPASADSTLYLS